MDASDNSDDDDHDFDEDDVSLQSETDQSEITSTSTRDNDVSDEEDDPRELSVLSEPVEVLEGWFGVSGKIPFSLFLTYLARTGRLTLSLSLISEVAKPTETFSVGGYSLRPRAARFVYSEIPTTSFILQT